MRSLWGLLGNAFTCLHQGYDLLRIKDYADSGEGNGENMSAKARAFRRHVGGDLPAGRVLAGAALRLRTNRVRRVRHRPTMLHMALRALAMVSGLPPKL